MAKTTTKKAAPQAPAKKETGTQVEVMKPRFEFHPEIERLYGSIGINESTWPALLNSMFPDVEDPDAILLALSYACARKLDPFKVKVHIIPFRYRMPNGQWSQRWQIVNSIGDLRATAFRTGEYCGKLPTTWGPITKYVGPGGVYECDVHSYCQITVLRHVRGEAREFQGPTVWFDECVQLRKAGQDRDAPEVPNSQWQKRPLYMLEKCAEAAALRVAFPEEMQALYIHEEIDVEDHAARFAAAKDVTPKPAAQAETKPETAQGNGAAEPQESGAEAEAEAEADEPKEQTYEFVRSDGEIIGDMTAEAFTTHVIGLLDRLDDGKMVEALRENNWEEVDRLPEREHQACETALADARKRTAPKPKEPEPKPKEPEPKQPAAQGTMLPDDDMAAEETVKNIQAKLRARETVGEIDLFWRGVNGENPASITDRCRQTYLDVRADLVQAGKV